MDCPYTGQPLPDGYNIHWPISLQWSHLSYQPAGSRWTYVMHVGQSVCNGWVSYQPTSLRWVQCPCFRLSCTWWKQYMSAYHLGQSVCHGDAQSWPVGMQWQYVYAGWLVANGHLSPRPVCNRYFIICYIIFNYIITHACRFIHIYLGTLYCLFICICSTYSMELPWLGWSL
jgi:hypothetical protein